MLLYLSSWDSIPTLFFKGGNFKGVLPLYVFPFVSPFLNPLALFKKIKQLKLSIFLEFAHIENRAAI